MVFCTLCRRRDAYRPTLLQSFLFIIQRQSSPITRSNQHGRLHPLSKMRHLSIETTLLSPFHHPETIKSDDTQRPTWSSAPFVEDSMSIDQDYFSLSFSSSRNNQVRWHAETKHGYLHPFRHLETIKSNGTRRQIMVIRTFFSIQRQSSPMARRDNYSHPHLCRRLNVYRLRLLQSPLFVIQRQASPLTRRDPYGRLHPLSKTQYLATETTKVSPFVNQRQASPLTCRDQVKSSALFRRRPNVYRSRLLKSPPSSTRGKRAR